MQIPSARDHIVPFRFRFYRDGVRLGMKTRQIGIIIRFRGKYRLYGI